MTLTLPTGGSFMVFQFSETRLLSCPPSWHSGCWGCSFLSASCCLRRVSLSPGLYHPGLPQPPGPNRCGATSGQWGVRMEGGDRTSRRKAESARRTQLGARPWAGVASALWPVLPAGSTLGSPGPPPTPPPSEQQRRWDHGRDSR